MSSASPQPCRRRADASRSGYRSRRITSKEFRLVLQAMPRKPPRYDVPNVAPEPLRFVQRFVNTVNLESGEDWLATWLEDEGVAATVGELERARVVREAIRELLYENNRQRSDGDPRAVLTAAADLAALSIDFSGPALAVRVPGVDGAVGRVLAVAFLSMLDLSWPRLKCCRNHHCRWSFYDYSKNRSASWCSMQLCGNRTKTRAYRARHAGFV
jgi:predicted RNA-binding Zn ribbon-like protein